MAITKVTRMDAQGRVILPPHIRKDLNLTPGQLLAVDLEGSTIQIRAAEERCCLCGESVEGENHAEVTIGPSLKRICYNCALAIVKKTLKEEA